MLLPLSGALGFSGLTLGETRGIGLLALGVGVTVALGVGSSVTL